jgi:pimeloyl-ACP methyl ester carboxylesterase
VWRRGLPLALYTLLVLLSLAIERPTAPNVHRPSAKVHAFGHIDSEATHIRVAYDDFPTQSDQSRPPVIILHGSPGRARELAPLARAFQSHGYRVLTPDLPGFGDSTRDPPDLSIEAHARQILALMDQLNFPRAHIIGWSLGGGVGMHMADKAPDRIASLTLMASISDQSVEGTRSYFAEHAKYAAGYTAATLARYAIPHFGLLAPLDDIRNSMRNFWDTDMRPLAGIMQRLTTPTLILHGRHDLLVPPFAAEHSHDLIQPSRLVITEHSHFYPFLQPELAASHILPLLRRHDEPGIPALRQRADLAPEPAPLFGTPGRWLEIAFHRTNWIPLTLAGFLLLLWKFRTGAILLFLAVAAGLIDNGIAFAALILLQLTAAVRFYLRGRRLSHTPRIIGRGTAARTPSHWRDILTTHPIRAALATRLVPHELETAFEAAGFHRLFPLRFFTAAFLAWCLWMLGYFIASITCYAFIIRPLTSSLGPIGCILGIALTIPIIRSAELLLTRHGRRRLRMSWTRLTRREYWPAELLYWPMAPFYIAWGLRHGPIAFTACNPGIDSGGGVIGESKQDILDALADAHPWVLRSIRIGRGSPETRAGQALAAIAANPALAFPVILKPDAGYRGFAVKLARSEQDVRNYFAAMHAPAIVQEYHPGPNECGILWARDLDAPPGSPTVGRIFSITRKTFPILTGDGRRPLEDLILRHPRFHAQAGIFLERWAPDRRTILSDGQALRLAESGNHCQGTLFSDGQDLITPELEARIDAIARSFRGGLDIGRFDLRYESDEKLRSGEGFRIIELNGVTGESTNIYDPARSLLWAFAVTIRQWRLMYQLGAARIRAGHKPLPVRELFRRIREHKRSRSGPPLAD